MTTLFRQGVEFVCKGKRGRQSARPPCRRKRRWSWGLGEAEHGLGPGAGALKGRAVTEQCWILRAGGQAATFMYPDALLPTSK